MTSALKTYLVKESFIVSSERHKEGVPGQRGRSVLIMRALTVSELGGREVLCRPGSNSGFPLEVCLEAAQRMTSSRSQDCISKRIQDVYREEMIGCGWAMWEGRDREMKRNPSKARAETSRIIILPIVEVSQLFLKYDSEIDFARSNAAC